jgi:Cu/Ag efflux protein CusF
MKRLVFPLALLLSASVAFAQAPPGQAPPEKTKEVTGKVVATDPNAKTITLSDDAAAPGMPRETTFTVDAKAVATLKTVAPGEKVKLLTRHDATGKEVVTAIEKSDKPKSNPPENP